MLGFSDLTRAEVQTQLRRTLKLEVKGTRSSHKFARRWKAKRQYLHFKRDNGDSKKDAKAAWKAAISKASDEKSQKVGKVWKVQVVEEWSEDEAYTDHQATSINT